jgi:hypothetical protein
MVTEVTISISVKPDRSDSGRARKPGDIGLNILDGVGASFTLYRMPHRVSETLFGKNPARRPDRSRGMTYRFP